MAEPTDLVTETVLIDKWFAPPQQPIAHRRHPGLTGTVAGIDPSLLENTTQVHWFQPQQAPVPHRKQPGKVDVFRQGDPTEFTAVEDILVDKWAQPNLPPSRHRRFEGFASLTISPYPVQIGVDLLFVQRVKTPDTRLRLHTDLVAEILNSLIRQGILVHSGQGEWTIELP